VLDGGLERGDADNRHAATDGQTAFTIHLSDLGQKEYSHEDTHEHQTTTLRV
jgi:hypothetical protein